MEKSDEKKRKELTDEEREELKKRKERIRKARLEDVENDGKRLKAANKDLQAAAKKNRFIIWTVFLILLAVICVAIFIGGLILGLYLDEALLLSIGIFVVVIISTLIAGYSKVPHNHEDIVEVAGKYAGKPMKPGPHILFPYFGLEIIFRRVYLGTQDLDLFLDKGDGHGGDVEFKNISSPLKAAFFYQIFDSEKATYAIDDLLGALKDESDELLRSFFGRYTLDQAIYLKNKFNLELVASLLDSSSDTPNETLTLEEMDEMVVTQEEARETEFYTLLSKWGVRPEGFAISDLQLPEEIVKERLRVLTALKDLEVAEIKRQIAEVDRKTKEIDAKAEAKKTALEGHGEAKKMKSVMRETNLSAENTAAYLAALVKWTTLGENASVTLIEDSGAKASDGVKFGLGFGASYKKK